MPALARDLAFGLAGLAALLCGSAPAAAQTPPVDFATEVWPILDEHCIDCHGTVKRKGKLRLDMNPGLLKGGKHGPAIVPGKSDQSYLLTRVRGTDNDQRMPVDADPLSDEQIETLRRWIDEGANWPAGIGETDEHAAEARHWAYVPPERPNLPGTNDTRWVRNPIDAFALANLESSGLSPSPPADKPSLLRRVTLDLTGLPPTPEQLDAFLADTSPDAYERAVDRLLASPAYGEKWARLWLDLARFADSRGYEKDQTWSMWPYRDWVIRALNADMPFDRFTIEQLAGDLLPTPTRDQLIATGFNRCSMINEEGGVDPEEARVVSVLDRADTTATVWLGSTLACARCHDHKFDPISIGEYYSFFAFFNNSPIETYFVGDGETRVQSETIPLPRPDEQELLAREGALAESLAAFGDDDPRAAEAREALKAVRAQLAQKPTTQIMKELPTPRETRVMLRGNFLTPGDIVQPNVPAAMGVLASPRRDRLALAEWIVSPDNPLTARVHANRIWAAYFGRGIVETEEDFGTRSSEPTHPQLLDWLATEFVSSGWSQKHLHRLIVTSSTYRQASRVTPELLELDPHNARLTRGPRLRLEAETIRDQALAIGGLLSFKMGGPSVMPAQPSGIWSTPYSGEKWTESTGEDRYRRAVYTFWKRATPYPSFVAFDAPSRQVTCTRRSRTNTPLQALVTLNDPVYMECARGLAARTLASGGASSRDRLRWAFRACTARWPTEPELARLVSLLDQQLASFAADAPAAAALAGPETASSAPPAERAAWTIVANVLLNLDEVLNK